VGKLDVGRIPRYFAYAEIVVSTVVFGKNAGMFGGRFWHKVDMSAPTAKHANSSMLHLADGAATPHDLWRRRNVLAICAFPERSHHHRMAAESSGSERAMLVENFWAGVAVVACGLGSV
jgi:hypothetical protein